MKEPAKKSYSKEEMEKYFDDPEFRRQKGKSVKKKKGKGPIGPIGWRGSVLLWF